MFTKTIDRICLSVLGIFMFLSPVIIVAADGNTSSISSITPTQNAADGKVEFVYAVGEDGKKTKLKTKLITTSVLQKLYPKPNEASRGQALDVGAFSVFHQIKTAEGRTEEGDFYRVADSKGKPLGWLKKSKIAVWKTRYTLSPIDANMGDGVFTVYNIHSGETRTKEKAEMINPPASDKLRLAFILEPPKEDLGDDTIYEVLCLDRVADQRTGGVKDILKNLKDLSMEIVFVYEATDALAGTVKKGTSDETQMLKLLQNLMRSITTKFDEEGVSKLVRFGIVGFQDNTSHSQTKFPPPFSVKVIQPLTTDSASFRQAVDRMPAYVIGGDWPEDGLSGISMALDMLDKDEYSSKHIIYFGCSSPHEHGRGQPHTTWGTPRRFATSNLRADLYDTSTGKFTGYTQSGLTVRSIMDRAAPKQGNKLSSKTIHTIMSSAEREDILGDLDKATRENYMRLAPAMNAAIGRSNGNDQLVANLISAGLPANDFGDINFIQQCWDFYQSRERGFTTLQLLSSNTRGNYPGYHGRADATKEQYERVANDLYIELSKIIPVLQAAMAGDPEAVKNLTDPGEKDDGKFTSGSFRTAGQQSIQDLLGEDKDSFEGSAPVRDDDGYLVAYKQVMVGKNELREFATKLDGMITIFKDKADREARTGIKELLKDLQQYAIQTVTGEEFKVLPESELKAILTELPLQTSALDMTPKNLQVLDSEEFERWVESIRLSRKRCLDLLDDSNKWSALTASAPQDEFAFIRLEDMP